MLSYSARQSRAYAFAALVAVGATIAAGWALSPAPAHTPGEALDLLLAGYTYAWDWAEFLKEGGSFAELSAAAVSPLVQVSAVSLGGLVAAYLALRAAAAGMTLTAYGEASFATMKHIRRMKVLGRVGPILGRFRGRLLRPAAPRSTLVLAPTRAGKTRGVVIPTILTYPGSLVVIDPKLELIEATADAQRRRGHKVHVLEWSNPMSPDGWNPLGRELPQESSALERAVLRLAAMLYPTPKSDPYWQENARRNFVALALFEVYDARQAGRSPSVARRAGRLTQMQAQPVGEGGEQTDPLGDMLVKLAAEAELKGFPSRIAEDLRFFAAQHFKERSSHLNTLLTGMQLWRMDSVREATGKSTFMFPELRKTPTTLYLAFPQADAKAFGPLTAILLESLFAYMLDHKAGRGELPVLIVGEEWASLPQIPLLLDALAKGNGQGLHVMPVLQDLAQFEAIYTSLGKQQLITNCTHIVAFAQANPTTAKELSDLVGQQTRRKATTSGSWLRPFAPNLTASEEGVPLVRPEQWGEIPFGKHVLLTQGHFTRPVLCDTPFWDQDRRLRRLMRK